MKFLTDQKNFFLTGKKSFLTEKIVFLSPPPGRAPPPPKPSKKGRILDFLTTRFIAENFFSNKTCG